MVLAAAVNGHGGDYRALPPKRVTMLAMVMVKPKLSLRNPPDGDGGGGPKVPKILALEGNPSVRGHGEGVELPASIIIMLVLSLRALVVGRPCAYAGLPKIPRVCVPG